MRVWMPVWLVWSKGVRLREDEVELRPGTVRHTFSGVHNSLQERSHHPHHSLNISSEDWALHNVSRAHLDTSLLTGTDEVLPILLLNTTNPSPMTLPVRAMVDNLLFGGDTILPTFMPGQDQPLPLARLPRRPMRTYCQFQECTTAGNISRTIGQGITRLYQQSVPGVLMERVQANVHAMEYAGRRAVTPNTRTTRAEAPAVDVAERYIGDVGYHALSPDKNGSLVKMAEKASQVLIWNNLEMIDPPDNKRSAILMARMKSRNAFLCRMSAGLLPFCQTPSDGEEFDDTYEFNDTLVYDTNTTTSLNDSYLEPQRDHPGFPVLENSAMGFKLWGAEKSCEVQGGCQLNYDLPASIFDGFYIGAIVDNFLWFEKKLKKPIRNITSIHLIPDAHVTIRERWKWKSEDRNTSFTALALPIYKDIELVRKSRLPFLYVEDTQSLDTPQQSLDAPQQSFFDPELWSRPWMDWRLAQPCFNPATCAGLYDIHRKLCVIPLVMRVEAL